MPHCDEVGQNGNGDFGRRVRADRQANGAEQIRVLMRRYVEQRQALAPLCGPEADAGQPRVA